MIVKKCGGCEQLFEVEARHQSDTLRRTEGIVRTVDIDLCPACRQAAQVQGQPPTPEEPEAPAAPEQEEEPAGGAR